MKALLLQLIAIIVIAYMVGVEIRAASTRSACFEDEIGIWMDNRTTCIAVDDVMDASEYNSLIERVDRLFHNEPARFYGLP